MRKFATREVWIGKVAVGGKNPIRIQSMTTTNTRDSAATAEQIMRLADSGCEIARVTVQGIKEAESCEGIKNLLLQKGYEIPLVADIHFYPPAALRVADFVDKVRINPGNFADRRATFVIKEYNDEAYARELDKIEETFTPLVEKCKRLKRAMRIGTNHGSLSDRIMNRYGDTPHGMVESALEFARICRKIDYHDFLFSMKASNPLVMVQAYRLLVEGMQKSGWDYPLHLGVTEAGDGEDGRVKSAAGIGSLLLDGIGDTIRVSLTEDPWCEIDPCKRLIVFAKKARDPDCPPFSGKRPERPLQSVLPHRGGTVIGSTKGDFILDGGVLRAQHGETIPLFTARALPEMLPSAYALEIAEPSEWPILKTHAPSFVLFAPTTAYLREGRAFFQWLSDNQIQVPVFLSFSYTGEWDDIVIAAATECGALLVDGLADGLFLQGPGEIDSLSFTILQALRRRASRTEFISCPGCGRTLFDLQTVTQRIRARTGHLPGVKIAVMGCVVNGPGEMADADFGYVGSKTGKIDLYVGKQVVKKDIDAKDAVEELVSLIQANGLWKDNN
jgi:(E)-4-hydroxy-3-methylbut-2-enyl-diphosphate synthase